MSLVDGVVTSHSRARAAMRNSKGAKGQPFLMDLSRDMSLDNLPFSAMIALDFPRRTFTQLIKVF